MPAFSEERISDKELEAIAKYIESLEGEEHAHSETIELTAAVEMHHWMALESLKADDTTEAVHHLQHIIELLEPGEHRSQMEDVLKSLQAGETHAPEHEIEEMLAGTASPDLTILDLHLRQASVALVIEDVSDAQHHVAHAQEFAQAAQKQKLGEIVDLLKRRELHDAEHEMQEILGDGEGRPLE